MAFGKIMYVEIVFLSFLSNFNFDVAEKLRNTAFIDGDFIIGALFSIHTAPPDKDYPLECGPIENSEGIGLVEAAFFAIDTINKDEKLLPEIKLGINIKDDCENERIALYQTMHMIKQPKFEDEMPNSSSPITCTNRSSVSPLIGMVGTMTTLNMLHYENLLKLFKIPQIGYSTSLSELISPYYYLSVVPSDYHLALLIIKILKKFNWSYIAVAYSNEYFGMNGKFFLEQWVSNYNICISHSIHIQDEKEKVAYVQSTGKLFMNDKARVIVCFCNENSLKQIFEEMQKYNATGKYFILNSNEWSISEDLVNKYQEQAEGMLLIGPRNNLIPGFEDYISALNMENNERNPWFKEYFNSQNTKLNLISTELNIQNAKIAYVIKSIYAFAQGLQEMFLEICGSKGVSLQCLKKKPFNTSTYMNYLINLDFRFFNIENVDFSFHGSPQIGKFDIYNLQRNSTTNLVEFVKIGYYDCHHDNNSEDLFQHLHVSDAKIKYPSDEKVISVCSENCSKGYAQVIDKERLCCWQCIRCEDTEYVHNKSKCVECQQGYLPDHNKTGCVPAPTEYMKWDDPRSLIAASISCCIIISAVMTADVFARNRHTAVIRSSPIPLDYIMLCGVIILSGCNFTLMIKPSAIVCTLAKTLPSVAISLIYIPVIFKTLQIFYVMKAMKNRDPKFPLVINSLKAQVIIISTVLVLEMVILIGWIIIQDKSITRKTLQLEPKTVIYLKCVFKKKHWLDIVFIAMHLIMIYYAIKIRKMSHNFHEAKFLVIFALVQTSTNVAFRIVYNSSSIFEIDSMFIGFSIDSLVTLLFLFFPKLYIIVWRPDMNTDDNFKSFLARYYSYQ